MEIGDFEKSVYIVLFVDSSVWTFINRSGEGYERKSKAFLRVRNN